MEALALITAFIAWFAGGLIGVVTGIGAGLAAMPLLTVFYDAKWAIALSTLAGGLNNVILLWHLRRYVVLKDLVSTILIILAGGVCGIPLYFLLPSWFLTFAVGALVLLSYWITRQAQKKLSETDDAVRLERIFAFLAGATIAAISVGGPWLGIFIALKPWDKNRSRAFFVGVVIPIWIFSVLSYTVKGVYLEMGWPVMASVCLGSIAGAFAGFFLESKINDALFKKLVLFIVKISGIFMLIQGILGFFAKGA